MQSDKFTAIVRNAIGAAQTAALSANHQKLTGEHILAALLKDDNMTVKMLINKAGGDAAAIRRRWMPRLPNYRRSPAVGLVNCKWMQI